MAYRYANPNPCGARVGDCVVRAIAIATGDTWEKTYMQLANEGYMMCDMPSSNAVWAHYLKKKGFRRGLVSDACLACYTVRDFCSEYPHGTYVIGTGTHAVAVIDGDYYDSWDSGDEMPVIYFKRS